MDVEGSVGVQVPSVTSGKGEPVRSEDTDAGQSKRDLDKDILCPICFQTMKDAFSTACGHSFCYTCIMTHLNNKKNCPCCGQYLTNTQVFPNFLLNKLLKKASACQLVSSATPLEHFKLFLQQEGAEVSVKDLDSLLSLLAEKKRKAEQEEAETNMEILLDFLHRLHQQKQEELNELQADLQFIKEDVSTVEKQRQELLRARERYSVKLRMLLQGSSPHLPNAVTTSSMGNAVSMPKDEAGLAMISASSKKGDVKERASSITFQKRDQPFGGSTNCISNLHSSAPSPSMAIAKKKRVLAQVWIS